MCIRDRFLQLAQEAVFYDALGAQAAAGVGKDEDHALPAREHLAQQLLSLIHISLALGTRGLVNIQYLIYEGKLYVIEVNPLSLIHI